MKNGVFRIAFRNLKNNKMYFGLAVILLVFCFILFAICEFLYVRIEYNRYLADRVLAKGTKNTGLITLLDGDNEDLMNFRLEAYKNDIVDSIGSSLVYATNWSCLNELIERQSGKSKLNALDYDELSLGYVCIDATLMRLCDLKLKSGSMINKENFDFEDQNLVAMYLGDLFSDIPIGTEYKLTLGKERVITIRVMGIISKGEEWVGESVGSIDGDIIKSSYNLDNEVIMAFNDGMSHPMMFYTLNKGDNMEDTQSKLYDLAEKHNLDIIAGCVSARFDGISIQYEDLRETLFALTIFITTISTMIIICFNAVAILSRKKQYGVLLASGISKGSLFFSLGIEQAVKAILGLLLSGLVIWVGTPLFFILEEIDVVYDIFLNFVLWKTVVFCVAECILVSGVSVLILGHYKPVQLIKYHN